MSACDQWFINIIVCVSDMQQLANVDPGPVVGTQLMRQLAHRSTALWETLAASQVRSCTELRTFEHVEIVSFSFCRVL